MRGPAVFGGYWRQPEATAAAFVDGWFRTGDLGARSADGYVTLRGRASDLVISGGFNIYPREIEEVLLEQPGVREAAVLGVPDERRGEVPVASFAGEADPAALEAACRRQLASFKVPRAFVRVDALPRNAMGKVDKGRLREALVKGRAPGGSGRGPVKRDAPGEQGTGTGEEVRARGVGTGGAYGRVWLSLAWGGSTPPGPAGLLATRRSSYFRGFGVTDRRLCSPSSRWARASAAAFSDGSFAAATRSSRRTRWASCPPPIDHFTE